jgi:SAM-dependent methyltransferase
MIEKDKLTKSIFEMYQEYPFPDINYKMDYSLPLIRFLNDNAKEGKKNLLDGANVLEAGCGTGNTIIKLAETCTTGSFTGVDMTINSLKIAKKNSEIKNLKNIKFQEQNILNLDLGKKFNVIFCIGVLHHLTDMQKGMQSLVSHLEDDGHLIMWLYGKDGRFKLNLNQRMLSVLFQNESSLKKKVELTKKILKNEANKYLDCHFNVPDSKIEDKWNEGVEFLLKNDNWIVDQFLHYNEKVVDMRDIYELNRLFNLEIVEWLGTSTDIKKYVPEESIQSIFSELSTKDKHLVLDDLLKPKYYFLVLKKKR